MAAPLGMLMVGLIFAQLLARIMDSPAVQVVTWSLAACVVLAARRSMGLREGYLLVLSAVLTGSLVVWGSDPAREIAAALDQATFLMTFILLMGLLHEAASTSPSVESCGRYLTQQPAGRQYPALYAGTGVMAVLFNLGVVSFLVPLVRRGIAAATPGDAQNPVRERRQISAVLRGFAWSVVWSPTAIAPLAVVELIPGVNRPLWIGLGFGIYLAMLLLGAVEDKLRFRAFLFDKDRPAAPFPLIATALFFAACGVMFTMTLIAMWLTGDTVVFGLMLACPVMLTGWLGVQYLQPFGKDMVATVQRALTATGQRLHHIVTVNLPKSAAIAVTLGCSGFVGRAAASLMPADSLATGLGIYAMPDFVLLSLIPVLLSLLSLLALSPIMMAVFFGSLFGSLDIMPANPTLIALSISCGWALSMTFSPFATVVLLIDRVAGISPRRLTWGWNLTHAGLSAVALVPIFAMLAWWV
ncbi:MULTISPECIES: hypothetical protein [unclassified Yoonia]|uniref:hypothetical protein n=1 Tax=unclassified Yoonia TaxID=2629118 RepID=UPI002AFEABA2|nr:MULTISPECIES: hypothetical protein [unclassified Yoonia]